MASEPLPQTGEIAVPPRPVLVPALGAERSPATEWREILYAALLAVVLTGAFFLAQRRIDWNPADEGFLWDGAVRAAHGGVPLRDFRSYDPGRYYWAAAWAQLLGDGILALRLSTALFEALGLFCGLLAARRAVKSHRGLLLVGILLLVWMSPRHKLFEPALTMMAVLVAVRLIEKVSLRRCFVAGALVGFAAFMGKNHGLYTSAATLCLLLFLHFRIDPGRPEPRLLGRRLLAWAAGGVAGFAPLLAMLPIPGFFASYVDSFRFFLLQGRTNVAAPFPWPWLFVRARLNDSGERLHALGRAELIAFGMVLLLVPLFFVAAAWFAATVERQDLRRRTLLLAGAFVGLFYAHHTYSRTDFFHLTQSLHPVLLGVVALPFAVRPERRRLAGVLVGAVLVVATALTAIPQAPLFHWLKARRETPFVPYDLAGDRVYLPARQAEVMAAVGRNLAAWVPPHEPILFAAHIPGFYPAFRRQSPVWDTYPMWPGIGGLDEQMLRELTAKNVRWALVATYPMPGNEELRFQSSHPLVWQYLNESFERVQTPDMPRRLRLFHKRSAT